MRSVGSALQAILEMVEPTAVERTPLRQCAGRVLHGDLEARISHPAAAVSSMDGYAVKAENASTGSWLRVVGRCPAGQQPESALERGEALRLFTGSLLPEGADAVAPQETVETEGDHVRLQEPVTSGSYVRPEGLDFRSGETLLRGPRRLTPEDLALAAAMNHPELPVASKPRVAILATGDELVLPGKEPGPAQVVASTGYGLAALIENRGAQVELLPPANDDIDVIRGRLRERRAEFFVTLGGASVGSHDIVGQILAREDLQLAFQGVAMRPGKPTLAGRLGSAVFIGLPGNPVSALVCAYVFLLPALDAALGLPSGPTKRLSAPLGRPVPASGRRDHYMRARLTAQDGRLRCDPFGEQDSSILRNLARADVLAIQPAGSPALAAGDSIEYIELR